MKSRKASQLEAPNAHPRAAHAERAAALALYTDLYTFAPVGYVMLTSRGSITEANRMAVKQLRMTRANLKRTTIQSVVAPEYSDAVLTLLKDHRVRHFLRRSLEVRLSVSGDGEPRTLQFFVARARGKILLAMLDLTEIRRLELAVREASLLERERLRAELHDGLGQELTGLSLALAALRETRDAADGGLGVKLEQLRSIAAAAITTCRTIVRGLAPAAKTGGGLIHALGMLASRPRRVDGPAIEFAVTEQSPIHLNEAAAEHLYRIAQEAIANIIKDGQASSIRLDVAVSPSTLILEVFDNGKGSKRAVTQGDCFDIMRYRAREIRGDLAIIRSRSGTRVRCSCPNSGD